MGFCGRASQTLDVNNKAVATEKMELKITYLNMISYGENTRKATLQELADGFFADKEVEYVKLRNQEIASFEPIDVTGENSFLVKLKEYSYEFEIDENLQLASVDGVKVTNPTREEIENLKTELEELKSKLETRNEVLWEGTPTYYGEIQLSKSAKDYDYLLVYVYGDVNCNINIVEMNNWDVDFPCLHSVNMFNNPSYYVNVRFGIDVEDFTKFKIGDYVRNGFATFGIGKIVGVNL